jgi:HD-GYP domain-containing protein (c-di-GMP phosphodiesterase class II)
MFSDKTLRSIFIISCAIAILYPLTNFYFIFPAFTNLLVSNTEEEGVRIAQHLSSEIISDEDEFINHADLAEEIEKSKRALYIEKIKVFSDSGEIIYSTNPLDIGKKNESDYFANIVSKGNVHTKVVQKNTKTLEARLVNADVVETYVPIMTGTKFRGAFEIYFDITSRNQALKDVMFRSAIVSFFMVFGFFLAIMMVLFKAEKGGANIQNGKLSLIYHSPFYLLLITFVSIFSAEAVIMFFLTVLSLKSKFVEAILDSSLLVMLVSPLLYVFLMRPLVIQYTKRKQAEDKLQKTNDNLEARVTERTAELLKAYSKLKLEIRERIHAEETMKITLDHMNALRSIDRAIISSIDLRTTLDTFLDQAKTQLNIDAAAVLVANQKTQMLEYVNVKGFRSKALKRTQLKMSESNAGRAAIDRHTIYIPNLKQEPFGCAIAKHASDERFITYFAVPLIARGRVKGVLELFHRTEFSAEPEWMDFLEALADQGAIAIDNSTMFDELQRSNDELLMAYDTTIEGWSRAMDLRDKETEGHSQRVAEMTLTIARKMGVKDDDLVHIKRGALLHDIGKVGIPDSILLKPGPLTDEEWQIMKRHPEYASAMLSPIEYLEHALDIPLNHHEKWDGTGYPRGLKGEEIPLAARIFAVVDVWDALSSERPYRPSWSKDKVFAHVRSLSGSHFDPKVLEVYLEIKAQEE